MAHYHKTEPTFFDKFIVCNPAYSSPVITTIGVFLPLVRELLFGLQFSGNFKLNTWML